MESVTLAISTMWYSTVLMTISENKNKQQNQKLSLWTELGALFGTHKLLSEKKKKKKERLGKASLIAKG